MAGDGAGTAREMTMTAEMFRTVTTCVAALFVTTMLVTAATSMPTLF